MLHRIIMSSFYALIDEYLTEALDPEKMEQMRQAALQDPQLQSAIEARQHELEALLEDLESSGKGLEDWIWED
ncbi:hypothetical protein [Pontibacter sp. G13]|uniref:hypothetical protein n=1 Tax=Pontibacter sp. G13 TaxID=3074898 RepID=UPI00288BF386|nr:hypothetical protein [Pontibacter sp. G13]WNJ20899.1 hypothetical protein RJD25_10505 [Pontibacter sp. G13]